MISLAISNALLRSQDEDFHDFSRLLESRTGHGLCFSNVREAGQRMMHPGKSGRFRASILGLAAMIGFVLLLDTRGLAQRTDQEKTGIDGFRELRWGTSIGQATKIYPDLYFEKYVISKNQEELSKVYARKGEHGDIENVTFDSIEYWFKGDHLYQITAELHSRIGPRTMVTHAEDAFDKMNGRLRHRFGDPSDHKVDYVTEFIVVVREATWIADHSAITIKYEGMGRTNEDLFMLRIRGNPER